MAACPALVVAKSADALSLACSKAFRADWNISPASPSHEANFVNMALFSGFAVEPASDANLRSL